LLSITRRSRKYSHAQTQEAPSPQVLLYMSALRMMEGLSLIDEQGGIPRTLITRSWPISCKRLRRRARTASWVCRKLWRSVTTGCLDGRIGRGYCKEPGGWGFAVTSTVD